MEKFYIIMWLEIKTGYIIMWLDGVHFAVNYKCYVHAFSIMFVHLNINHSGVTYWMPTSVLLLHFIPGFGCCYLIFLL